MAEYIHVVDEPVNNSEVGNFCAGWVVSTSGVNVFLVILTERNRAVHRSGFYRQNRRTSPRTCIGLYINITEGIFCICLHVMCWASGNVFLGKSWSDWKCWRYLSTVYESEDCSIFVYHLFALAFAAWCSVHCDWIIQRVTFY